MAVHGCASWGRGARRVGCSQCGVGDWGTGSDVMVFIPGISFSRKWTRHSGHAQTCPGTL